MKTKSTLFTIIAVLSVLVCFGQTAKYGELKKKGKYKTYISKEGKTFKVGDTLTIGKPSLGDQFTYVTQGNVGAAAFLAGNTIIINKMKIWGPNKLNSQMYFSIKGYGLIEVLIDYENAFDANEIIE